MGPTSEVPKSNFPRQERPGARSGLAAASPSPSSPTQRNRAPPSPPLPRHKSGFQCSHRCVHSFSSQHARLHGPRPNPVDSFPFPLSRPPLPEMYHAIRLRCLLTRPPVSQGISTSGGGGGCPVRRFSVVGAPRPWGAGRRPCRFYGSSKSKGGVGRLEDRGAASAAWSSGRCIEQEHARLGERDQQEWLSGETREVPH
ncbi:hypothetical protein GUJ93_ZPchr0006g43116 [Zizania palustris]|uniref:Uncharacterized protein n=1 Tax=Zizania palustris TaxID=103762 RepID=A0A8J5SHM9_ZIZPA|nr:hypothetical protein GUJ93_ZPchr0006g43116 [Zizania palustris]